MQTLGTKKSFFPPFLPSLFCFCFYLVYAFNIDGGQWDSLMSIPTTSERTFFLTIKVTKGKILRVKE